MKPIAAHPVDPTLPRALPHFGFITVAFVFLSCSSIHEYTYEARVTAARDLQCHADSISVVSVKPTEGSWPKWECPRASLVVSGCEKERRYVCDPLRKTSHPCKVSCRADSVAPAAAEEGPKEKVTAAAGLALQCPVERLQVRELTAPSAARCSATRFQVNGCDKVRGYECNANPSGDFCNFACVPTPERTPTPPPTQGACLLREDGGAPDVRLFVAGLNHAKEKGSVRAAGVKELVDFIVKDSGPRDNIVVAITGSDPRPDAAGEERLCEPNRFVYDGPIPPRRERSGECIAGMLEKTLGGQWSHEKYYEESWGGGGYAIIAGPRFKVLKSRPVSSGIKYLSVTLQNKLKPADVFTINVLHTSGNEAAAKEIRPQLDYFLRHENRRDLIAPLFVGDFNVPDNDAENWRCTTDTNVPSFCRLASQMIWANRNLQCVSGPSFDIDDKLHVLAGRHE